MIDDGGLYPKPADHFINGLYCNSSNPGKPGDCEFLTSTEFGWKECSKYKKPVEGPRLFTRCKQCIEDAKKH